MVQKKIPFKAARLEAEKEIEGSVPQQGKSYANAAAAATGMQTQAPNLSAPTTKKTTKQRSSQSGTELPGASRAEALASAIDLRETLRSTKNPKKTKNSSNAEPTAPGSNGAQQTPKNKKKRGRANQTQAKPGQTTAPAPQAAVDKQAPKPTNQPASKAGANKATAPAPQAAVAKQASKPNKQPATKAGHSKDPASAPQAAGSKQSSPSAEQAPVPSTSKAKPGVETEQASKTPLPSSDTESEMEVTSESAPQATEVKQDSQPVTDNNKGDNLKNGVSFAAAAKEGAQNKARTKIDRPKEAYNFEFKLANQRAKKKSWSRKPRPNGDGPVVQNKYTPLGWNLFEDPEEMDANVSFPSDWN